LTATFDFIKIFEDGVGLVYAAIYCVTVNIACAASSVEHTAKFYANGMSEENKRKHCVWVIRYLAVRPHKCIYAYIASRPNKQMKLVDTETWQPLK
jgi:hypothetical protein